MLLLEACTLANVKGLYNYQRREFSEAKKRELLTKMEGKYSKELETVLGKMLEYFPKDRLDYKQVRNKIEVHKNPVLVETVLSNEQKTEVKEENVEVKSKDCWPNV
jgi:beta-galactosidase beta subunit